MLIASGIRASACSPDRCARHLGRACGRAGSGPRVGSTARSATSSSLRLPGDDRPDERLVASLAGRAPCCRLRYVLMTSSLAIRKCSMVLQEPLDDGSRLVVEWRDRRHSAATQQRTGRSSRCSCRSSRRPRASPAARMRESRRGCCSRSRCRSWQSAPTRGLVARPALSWCQRRRRPASGALAREPRRRAAASATSSTAER